MYAEIQRRTEGYLAAPLSGSYLAILNLALIGIVDSAPAYIDKAIAELMYKLRNGGWAWDNEAYPISYDWLYNYMTTAQRDSLRSYIYSLYPEGVGGQRTVYYNLEANEAMSKGVAGLACYGDGGTAEENARFQALVDNCDGRMRGVREFTWPNGSATSKGGVLPAREFYFGDGGYYKGNHYGQKDIVSIVEYLTLFEDLGLGSYWNLCPGFLDNAAEYYLRIRRPDGLANRIMMGSNFQWDNRGMLAMALLAWKRSSPLALWIMDQFDFSVGAPGGYEWYFVYVCFRPAPPTAAPGGLALHKFYGEQGSGPNSGHSWYERIIPRTGWIPGKGSNDVYFHLTAGNYFGDYYDFFEPTFEIYYRGALAIRSGYYTSEAHDRYYYSNAISCNTVVVFDSTQSRVPDRWGTDFLYADSYGGPGRPVNIYDVRDQREKYGIADIPTFEVLPQQVGGQAAYYAKARVNPDVAYYYSNVTRKVRSLEREFFWAGGHFVVADHVKIDPSVAAPKKIRWLLHTIGMPAMSSTPLYSVVPGHIQIYDRGSYSALRSEEGYGGRITVVPLFPEGAQLRRVGGDGYECWVDSDWTHGSNYPAPDASWYANDHEVGRWRVETIAPGAPDSVDFLHYIFAGPPAQAPPQVQGLSGEGVIGCEIAGVGVIVFTREGAGEPVRYQTTGENFLPNFVSGLRPNLAYTIRQDGGEARRIRTDAGGVLCFEGRGGGVTIAPAPGELAGRTNENR